MIKCLYCGEDVETHKCGKLDDVGVSGTNEEVVDVIKQLAKLLQIEGHELLECIDDHLIDDIDSAPLWEILNT